MKNINELLNQEFYYAQAGINYKTKALDLIVNPMLIKIEEIVDTGTLYELRYSTEEKYIPEWSKKIHLPKKDTKLITKTKYGVFALDKDYKVVVDNVKSWVLLKHDELIEWKNKEIEKITEKFNEKDLDYNEFLKDLNEYDG